MLYVLDVFNKVYRLIMCAKKL